MYFLKKNLKKKRGGGVTGRVVFILAKSAYPAFQGHPFIMQYNDGNAEVVSMWVCRMLEERRSTQGPQ